MSMSSTFVSWAVSVMMTYSPPLPGEETQAEATQRYTQIAEAIVKVVTDPGFVPVVPGPNGRLESAKLALSIAKAESDFARDADVGPCLGKRCDVGRAACVMQLNVGAGKTPEGYTKADLFADRVKCIESGLNRARRSIGACRAEAREHWLADYAGGVCESPAAQASSRRKMRMYETIRTRTDAPSVELPVRLK
jgi:hypothetical protein